MRNLFEVIEEYVAANNELDYSQSAYDFRRAEKLSSITMKCHCAPQKKLSDLLARIYEVEYGARPAPSPRMPLPVNVQAPTRCLCSNRGGQRRTIPYDIAVRALDKLAEEIFPDLGAAAAAHFQTLAREAHVTGNLRLITLPMKQALGADAVRLLSRINPRDDFSALCLAAYADAVVFSPPEREALRKGLLKVAQELPWETPEPRRAFQWSPRLLEVFEQAHHLRRRMSYCASFLFPARDSAECAK